MIEPGRIRSGTRRFVLTGMLVAAASGLAASARADLQLVFGSFQNPQNAENWAARVSIMINTEVVVESVSTATGDWYRVVTPVLDESEATRLGRSAEGRSLSYWRITDLPADREQPVVEATPPVRAPNPQTPVRTGAPVRPAESLRPTAVEAGRSSVQMVDFDFGLQTRSFFKSGLAGQSRFHPSLSARLDYYRAWDDERQSFTFAPFGRYDAEDEERTHFDIREGFWSLIGNDWDLHLGVKQVFWGVTEFKHLVDIVNQTDLVENIDGEDKLGQPMAHLSLVRNWGILDFHVLTGFRERTFPGVDGRPRYFIPVDNDNATYESSAEDGHIDAVVRWSHHIDAFEFGIYHFSGTSRDPLFDPVVDSDGELLLRPHYPLIDQTGLDAQALYGDWAFKLEAINRSGFQDRYYAFNAGFERTIVGAFGTRADLGLVLEYLYDDRGDEAFDTFFENDVAFGTRWLFNDLGDAQALLGVIWDHESDETIITLEASRRVGDTWTLLLEGRAFTGSAAFNPINPLDPGNLGASVARDDYIELELTRYF